MGLGAWSSLEVASSIKTGLGVGAVKNCATGRVGEERTLVTPLPVRSTQTSPPWIFVESKSAPTKGVLFVSCKTQPYHVMMDLTEQCGFAAVIRPHYGTVPDQPHLAGRGGSFADSRDPVAGEIRQPTRPWLAFARNSPLSMRLDASRLPAA